MTAEAQPEDRSSPVGLPLVVVLTVETSESALGSRIVVEVPRFQDLLRPTLESLKDLGSSARIDEIVEAVVEREGFTEEQQDVKRSPGHSMSLLEYRLAWARNYLKNIGAIENSSRGVWAITDDGRRMSDEEIEERIRNWKTEYNWAYYEKKRRATEAGDEEEEEGDVPPEADWKERLVSRPWGK